jgi:hypothetical protein
MLLILKGTSKNGGSGAGLREGHELLVACRGLVPERPV